MQPHSSIPTKTCSRCGETKPATTEFFHRDRNRKDGLRCMCKLCVREYQRQHTPSEMAKARKVEYQRAWYLANRERVIGRSRAWYAANPDRAQAWRAARRAINAEQARAWRIANPERTKENARIGAGLRRARKLGASGNYTRADVAAQYKRQKGRCYWCGEKVGDDYHVDHIVPLSRGGTNWPENIVIACPTCNCSKGDKLPHEWVEGGRLL